MRLPELLIIGAQKCGTTALHDALSKHPEVHPACDPVTGQVVKEMHFFSLNYDKGVDWYASHFQPDHPSSNPGVCLDASPSYLCHKIVAPRLGRVVGTSKLIISLRDPVRRAMSQYNHYTQQQGIAGDWDWRRPGESFEANLQAELSDPRDSWFGMVRRGFYAEQIEHLLKSFPRDQIHVMIMERWSGEAGHQLAQLLQFIGLQSLPLQLQPVHQREYTVDPLKESTERQLRELYAPHNERLFGLLGESIDEWA